MTCGAPWFVQESRQRPDVLDLLLHPFITAVQPSIKAPTTELQVRRQCMSRQDASIYQYFRSLARPSHHHASHTSAGQGRSGVLYDGSVSSLSSSRLTVCRPIRRRCRLSRPTCQSSRFLQVSSCHHSLLKPQSDRWDNLFRCTSKVHSYQRWQQHVLPACLTHFASPSGSNHGGVCEQDTVAFCLQEEAQSSFQGAAMSPGMGSHSALNKRALPALQKTESVPDIVMAAAQVHRTCRPARCSAARGGRVMQPT